MNTMQLQCFLTVAETLNFAQAAKQLHVTQPAVTQQIRSLETELNFQLFHRTTRTVELTQEGLLFLGDAKAMMDIFHRVKKRGESVTDSFREDFTIGCHSSNDVFFLTKILEKMKEQIANIYPIFRIVPFQHLYQRLLEEYVDVVVAFRENGIKKEIHYQELVQVPVVAVTKGETFLSEYDEIHLGDLRKYPIITLEPQKCPEEYRTFMHEVLKDRSPSDVYFCDVPEAIITLAQAGYGVAVLPDFFQEKKEPLRCLPILDAPLLSYGIYYKASGENPLRRAFLKLVKEQM